MNLNSNDVSKHLFASLHFSPLKQTSQTLQVCYPLQACFQSLHSSLTWVILHTHKENVVLVDFLSITDYKHQVFDEKHILSIRHDINKNKSEVFTYICFLIFFKETGIIFSFYTTSQAQYLLLKWIKLV